MDKLLYRRWSRAHWCLTAAVTVLTEELRRTNASLAARLMPMLAEMSWS